MRELQTERLHLRLPPELKEYFIDEARKNVRTLNDEIVTHLQQQKQQEQKND